MSDLHTVPLRGGWRLWRQSCLRGAGFPAREVLRLAPAEELTRRVEAFLWHEAEELRSLKAAVASCQDATQGASREEGKRLGAALRALRAGGIPAPVARCEAPLLLLAERHRATLEARALLQQAFAEDRSRAERALREVASSDRFREAVAWQNVRALGGGIDWLLRQPLGATGFKVRQNEALVVSYLQRYALRNETIGFFGPVGWAAWTDGPELLSLHHAAPEFVERRTTYFEYWCIQALAEILGRDPELRMHLRPRRLPGVRLEGATVHYGRDRSTDLPTEHLEALRLCDGKRTCHEIGPNEVLTDLEEGGLISTGLILSPQTPHPEVQLRQVLTRMPPSPARERALAALASLESGRDAVARAAGNSGRLVTALSALTERFSQATGGHAIERAHGRTYAGRTLVYEDCRRSVSASLGRGLLEPLAGPLSLILQSARWYTHQIASRYLARFQEDFRALAPSGPVSFLRFFERTSEHFRTSGQPPRIVTETLAEFHTRWARVLMAQADQQEVWLGAEALWPRVQAEFSAPAPGWPKARHVAPDVLIAASSAEAIGRGDYFFVLGEVHIGQCTFTHQLFRKEHPDPGALVRAREADLGQGLVDFVEARAIAGRTVDYSPSPHDYDVETGDTPSSRPTAQVLPLAELLVDLGPSGELQVRTRDGAHRFGLIAFLEHFILAEASDFFRLFAPARHVPRIWIDRLVVQRETWRFEAPEFAFAHLEEPLERFVGLSRWRRAQGLPRHAFFRASKEPKPCFVDFDSPAQSELFLKLARQSESISVSEMLPGFEQLWLTDGLGQRYTSELRLTAVDPVPF